MSPFVIPKVVAQEFQAHTLKLFDLPPQIFLIAPKALLQPTQKLVFLAFRKGQIVVRELRIFLLQLSFEFIPISFEV